MYAYWAHTCINSWENLLDYITTSFHDPQTQKPLETFLLISYVPIKNNYFYSVASTGNPGIYLDFLLHFLTNLDYF